MSGLPYNELQDVDITATDKDGVTHVLATEHYAFVIPCKECRWYLKSTSNCHLLKWNNYDSTIEVDPDCFCSWGERKVEE